MLCSHLCFARAPVVLTAIRGTVPDQHPAVLTAPCETVTVPDLGGMHSSQSYPIAPEFYGRRDYISEHMQIALHVELSLQIEAIAARLWDQPISIGFVINYIINLPVTKAWKHDLRPNKMF